MGVEREAIALSAMTPRLQARGTKSSPSCPPRQQVIHGLERAELRHLGHHRDHIRSASGVPPACTEATSLLCMRSHW